MRFKFARFVRTECDWLSFRVLIPMRNSSPCILSTMLCIVLLFGRSDARVDECSVLKVVVSCLILRRITVEIAKLLELYSFLLKCKLPNTLMIRR